MLIFDLSEGQIQSIEQENQSTDVDRSQASTSLCESPRVDVHNQSSENLSDQSSDNPTDLSSSNDSAIETGSGSETDSFSSGSETEAVTLETSPHHDVIVIRPRDDVMMSAHESSDDEDDLIDVE